MQIQKLQKAVQVAGQNRFKDGAVLHHAADRFFLGLPVEKVGRIGMRIKIIEHLKRFTAAAAHQIHAMELLIQPVNSLMLIHRTIALRQSQIFGQVLVECLLQLHVIWKQRDNLWGVETFHHYAKFKNFLNLRPGDSLDLHALARDTFHHAFDHQPIKCLLNRCIADFIALTQNPDVQFFAWRQIALG
ncbi:hypothetical protein SDC9_194202 [bioreactor metagenome]|uniref:Uncharacterized protein n=1 Tax=bioreactor metagenome TaxID=1076179 RepID=A0A645I5M7_9ZZZZ